MRTELAKVKAENPKMDHKAAFTEAAKNVGSVMKIVFGQLGGLFLPPFRFQWHNAAENPNRVGPGVQAMRS